MTEYSIGEFIAVILIAPVLSYLAIILFDGLGIFKDNFYISNRRMR